MSTAQDETEIGRAQHIRDEKGGDDERSNGDEEEQQDALPTLVFEGPEEGENANNDIGAQDLGNQNDNDSRGGVEKDETSLALRRPSSADGSSSIPDDTPSIQVMKFVSQLDV